MGFRLAAAASDFDVLVTCDQNMGYQQNLSLLPMAAIVVVAPSNKLEGFLPLVPILLSAIDTLVPKCLSFCNRYQGGRDLPQRNRRYLHLFHARGRKP